MPIEEERDDVADAFHESYELVIDRTPIEELVWPPVPTTLGVNDAHGHWAWSGWKAATAGFLLTGAFGFGWLTAPSPGTTATDPFEVVTVTTAIAVPETATALFASPFDAAIAAALVQDPDLLDPHVTRLIGIYADDQIVNLRAQVRADGFCHWYGVMGRVQEVALVWSGGPALPCDA